VTILVIEDNAITRQIIRLSLSAQGYSIIEAEDGATAISKMAENQPDLVIQDLALPDIDGLTLAQTLHGMPGREDVPIVAFSAFIDRLDKPAPPSLFSRRLYRNRLSRPSWWL
jgi:CheY-like chemotaxis protein